MLFPGGIFKIYAIIESGGKQYKVTPGQRIEVECLNAEDGATINLDRVLMLADANKVILGKPLVDGARVKATVQGNIRSAKITVFKYKSKVRYSKMTGHRQGYTKLAIDKIIIPGAEKKAAAAKKKVVAKKKTTATTKKTTGSDKPDAKKEVIENGS
jgi:large subunit ribosomal protein L21